MYKHLHSHDLEQGRSYPENRAPSASSLFQVILDVREITALTVTHPGVSGEGRELIPPIGPTPSLAMRPLCPPTRHSLALIS